VTLSASIRKLTVCLSIILNITMEGGGVQGPMSRNGGETWGTRIQHSATSKSIPSGAWMGFPSCPPLARSAKGWGDCDSTASWKCLAGFIALHEGMGSFGCVVVRVADDNFAQDDSGEDRGIPPFRKVRERMGHPSVV
jgi:hypothetical protein